MKNYFETVELVPDFIYKIRGESARELMDNRIVEMANLLRDWCDTPMIINNVKMGRNFCGLRTKESEHYSPFSQHSFGRAIDFICKISPTVFHKQILLNLNVYKYITFIEVDINGWVHIDCRYNYDGSRIKVWSPTRGSLSVEKYLSEI